MPMVTLQAARMLADKAGRPYVVYSEPWFADHYVLDVSVSHDGEYIVAFAAAMPKA